MFDERHDITGEVSRVYEFPPIAQGLNTTVIEILGGETFEELSNGAHAVRAGRQVHIIPTGWRHLCITFPPLKTVGEIEESSTKVLAQEADA